MTQPVAMRRFHRPACTTLLLLGLCPFAAAQDTLPDAPDVADIPAERITLREAPAVEYLLIGADKAKEPEEGWRVLFVLPGGDGSPEFLPFVKRIRKNALSDKYIIVELVSPNYKGGSENRIVWPTERVQNTGTPDEAAVEQYMSRVWKDLTARCKVDARYVFSLSWSSGGPAAYAMALAPNTPIKGSLVAMSVFKPNDLPSLDRAKGRAFYILHSPDDKVCPIRMARDAREKLSAVGASVQLSEYAGGHGWRGDVFGNIRSGIAFLESRAQQAPPAGTGK